jgi:dTMP kinase
MSASPDPTRGTFIVFEGGDGSGKSTQAAVLAKRLSAVLTREPGGTAVGTRIRTLVLDPAHPELADRTEALLMAAARAQHVDELIRPALGRGQHVISDRYIASSLAYQGVGRGLGLDVVADLNRFAVDGLYPDLTVLLDADPRAARARLGDDLDRIEDAGSELAERVVETYRHLAAADPEQWALIDANGTIDEVAQRVDSVIAERLGL